MNYKNFTWKDNPEIQFVSFVSLIFQYKSNVFLLRNLSEINCQLALSTHTHLLSTRLGLRRANWGKVQAPQVVWLPGCLMVVSVYIFNKKVLLLYKSKLLAFISLASLELHQTHQGRYPSL